MDMANDYDIPISASMESHSLCIVLCVQLIHFIAPACFSVIFPTRALTIWPIQLAQGLAADRYPRMAKALVLPLLLGLFFSWFVRCSLL